MTQKSILEKENKLISEFENKKNEILKLKNELNQVSRALNSIQRKHNHEEWFKEKSKGNKTFYLVIDI